MSHRAKPPTIDTAYLSQVYATVNISFWYGSYKVFMDLQLDGAFGSKVKHPTLSPKSTYLTTIYREYIWGDKRIHGDGVLHKLKTDLDDFLGSIASMHPSHLSHPKLLAAHFVAYSLHPDLANTGGLVSLGGWESFGAHGEPPGYLHYIHVDCSRRDERDLPVVTYHSGSFIPS